MSALYSVATSSAGGDIGVQAASAAGPATSGVTAAFASAMDGAAPVSAVCALGCAVPGVHPQTRTLRATILILSAFKASAPGPS